MPVFKTGDMWSVFDGVHHFIITTNAVVKGNGGLVMGAGIARQVRDRFAGVDVEMGQAVAQRRDKSGFYGLILGSKLGLFQVKYHFRDQAYLALIERSAQILTTVATAMPFDTFALNFPGIGNGGRHPDEVRPLLMGLPDNVHIWSFH